MTSPESQPDAASPEEKSSRWPLYLISALFIAGVLATVAWNVELPYRARGPGPVADAADSIVAEQVATYEPSGELLMLTVVGQDVNVYEALIVGFDPTLELIRKEAIFREGETDEEYRNRVLQQMDDSNYRSILVALTYLGIDMVPVEVVVNELVEGVPAEAILELGDTIIAVDGKPVAAVADVGAALEGAEVGDVVEVLVRRGDDVTAFQVELAERSDEPGVPMIGFVPGELTKSPFPLEIQAGDVGGPSAGMMHALAIIDTLTEGDLTKGNVIAGTGTIRVDGSVGNIGGIRQKVVAAEAAGASHILVPEGQYDTALTAERESIEIIPVATIDEAVEFLETLPPA
jgi:PDZ domain-containing protein